MTNDVTKQTEETPAENNQPTDSVTDETNNSAEMISAAATTEEEQSSSEMDFGAILEQFEQEQTAFSKGELVSGKVVGISDRGVLIDFGYKSEGVADIAEFTSPEGEVTVKQGDEVEVTIRSMDSGDNPPFLSRMDALRRRAWNEIETAYNEGAPITGRVIDKTKGGLRVDINGVEAFLPGSQVDSRPIRNLDSFRGQEIEARVIKFSRKRNNIVLSRKVLTDEINSVQKASTLSQVEEGYVVEGVVKSLLEYGAFVDIGGIDGLLHVTDMSWGRLDRPSEMFKVSDHVQVKILRLDREKEKVSLGYKQLIPDPWATVAEIYPIGSRLKGRVSSVADYGAFVELEPGVEGLVHISEMSWSKRVKHPKNLVNTGDEVEVQVLGIDPQDRRISLGMKQMQPNPWETVGDRYHVGDKVHGRVRNLTDFGAFIEIEDGIDGLVHVSDISWSKKIKHPKDVLKKGQEVDAVVTNIDTPHRRLSLSIKELQPSAWESFVATHRPGDVVRGKISRFAGFGVFVELGDELEGLCHISELSDERVNRAEDVVQLGQELDFKILRIEADTQKIGLSHRAVGKEDEPQVDTKVYTTEAKGGMASLGELANLKFGREPEQSKAEEAKSAPKKEEPKAEESTAAATSAETAPEAETSPEVGSEENTGEVSTEDTAVETSSPTSEQTVGENIETAGEESAVTEESKEETAETPAAESTGETAAEESTDETADAAVAATAEETSAETTAETTSTETTETGTETETETAAQTSETTEAASAGGDEKNEAEAEKTA
ncbi:MAG TPA: 30S ribosomal protein S1 [Pyrinomonadaceae bacterium]|jgi:small subunit ribosomal protein S1